MLDKTWRPWHISSIEYMFDSLYWRPDPALNASRCNFCPTLSFGCEICRRDFTFWALSYEDSVFAGIQIPNDFFVFLFEYRKSGFQQTNFFTSQGCYQKYVRKRESQNIECRLQETENINSYKLVPTHSNWNPNRNKKVVAASWHLFQVDKCISFVYSYLRIYWMDI